MPEPLFALPIDDIPGVGKRMQMRLRFAQISTIKELYNAQPKHLRALWGNVNGERMWYALHGYDIYALPTSRGMYGHGRVLPPQWRSIDHATACSRLLITKAARRMRRDGFYAGKLWLWLDMRNGGWFKELTLPSVQDDFAILAALNQIWLIGQTTLPHKSEIIRVGVTLADLSPANERQLDMFVNDDNSRIKCEAITNTIDRLNSKFGKRVVTVGAWTPPPGGFVGGKIAYNRIPSAEDFW
jgi:DNA polymerase-4